MSQERLVLVPACSIEFFIAVVIAIFVLSGNMAAQDDAAGPLQEPQYNGQFFAIGAGGALTPLEQTKMVHQMKSQNRFISVKVTGEEVVPNAASSVRLGPGTRFVVRTGPVPDGIDPNTLISLKPFLIEKNQRAILQTSAGGYIFQSGKGQTTQDTSIAVSIKKFGVNSMEVVPIKPLAPGEYVLMTHAGLQGVSCFGVDAGAAGGARENGATSPDKLSGQAFSVPASPVWRTHPVSRPNSISEVYEATLPGIAEASGKQGSALLDVKCTVSHFTNQPNPSGSIDTELRVRRKLVGFATDHLGCTGDQDGDYNDFAHIRLGTRPEYDAQFCFDGEIPADQNAIVGFGLGLDTSIFRTQSDADSLNIRVRIDDGQSDALNAKFAHAQNASALQSAIDPCLKLIAAATKAEEARIVVSCPVIADESLTGVDVLLGLAMKKLTPDPENDVGIAWNLPKASKTRVRPKLTLACEYKTGAQLEDTKVKPERKLLPIPGNAADCVFRHAGERAYGRCSRQD